MKSSTIAYKMCRPLLFEVEKGPEQEHSQRCPRVASRGSWTKARPPQYPCPCPCLSSRRRPLRFSTRPRRLLRAASRLPCREVLRCLGSGPTGPYHFCPCRARNSGRRGRLFHLFRSFRFSRVDRDPCRADRDRDRDRDHPYPCRRGRDLPYRDLLYQLYRDRAYRDHRDRLGCGHCARLSLRRGLGILQRPEKSAVVPGK